MRSSTKRVHDAAARAEQIERAHTALEVLSASLSSSRCRLRDRVALENAAKTAINGAFATRRVRFDVKDELSYDHRQEQRGRPGPNTRYRRIERHCLFLTWSTDAEAVAYDAASDGCLPMVTCDARWQMPGSV
ncbi:MAG: hypothetical protein ACYCXY_12575, partial [Acidimicrobiales bacterium]